MSTVTAVPIPPVKSSVKIWLWVGLLLAVAAAFGLAWAGTQHITEAQFLAWNKHEAGVKTTASGLQYKELTPGTGPIAVDGDGAVLTVRGTLIKGKEFQPETPLRVMVGQQTIPGFTEGVKLMKKGSKFRFWLPPNLGYGAPDGPKNPLSDKVLVFDVEMTDLISGETLQAMQRLQQSQQGGPGGPGGPGGGAPEGEPQVQPEQ
jgi:FKBP-type peptidyl-prolyl cis-trans isomerase/Domain amino terminal to FKBP-type peptidyl-prolyl isomerase